MKIWNKWKNDAKEIKIADFGGPVAIAAGIVVLLNAFTLSTNSINFYFTSFFENLSGYLNLGLGIIIIALGSIYILLHRKPEGMSRLAIISGLSIFSWGTKVLNILDYTNCIAWVVFVGWFATLFGLMCLVLGCIWAKNNIYS